MREENHPADEGQTESELQQLLSAATEGDRAAAAELVHRYGDRIRRHVRMKLSPDMRRVFDSMDVLSSVARRVDQSVRRGGIDLQSEEQLIGFLRTVAKNTAVDQARKASRMRRNDALANVDEAVAQNSRPVPDIEVGSLTIQDPTDHAILEQWSGGRSHRQIAAIVGLSEHAVRQRLSRLLRRLREDAYAREDSDR